MERAWGKLKPSHIHSVTTKNVTEIYSCKGLAFILITYLPPSISKLQTFRNNQLQSPYPEQMFGGMTHAVPWRYMSCMSGMSTSEYHRHTAVITKCSSWQLGYYFNGSITSKADDEMIKTYLLCALKVRIALWYCWSLMRCMAGSQPFFSTSSLAACPIWVRRSPSWMSLLVRSAAVL